MKLFLAVCKLLKHSLFKYSGIAIVLVGMSGCDFSNQANNDLNNSLNNNVESVQFFDTQQIPKKLSSWGLFKLTQNTLAPADQTHIYELNTALFSDYALKLRTIYIPPNSQIKYNDYAAFEFPVGSIITKTFYYPTASDNIILLQKVSSTNDKQAINKAIDLNIHRVIETRLLVRQPNGWQAIPYIWRGGEAHLAISGDLLEIPIAISDDATSDISTPLNYLVPSRNQCSSCHATNHTSGKIWPIGPKARHLNRTLDGHNQLHSWANLGILSDLPETGKIPANAAMADTSESVEHRARSYLDINCGHCHNPQGAADTSGLMLDYQEYGPRDLGTCKPPIAAGRGSGGRLYGIVPGKPDESILSYRMQTTNPASMMPELGRSLSHAEGVALITEWITQTTGECL